MIRCAACGRVEFCAEAPRGWSAFESGLVCSRGCRRALEFEAVRERIGTRDRPEVEGASSFAWTTLDAVAFAAGTTVGAMLARDERRSNRNPRAAIARGVACVLLVDVCWMSQGVAARMLGRSDTWVTRHARQTRRRIDAGGPEARIAERARRLARAVEGVAA